MSENKRITVLGGDMRLFTAAKLFSKDFSVFCYGCFNSPDTQDIIYCNDLLNALSQSQIILLGIPCSADGMNVNAPFTDKKISLEYLTDILPCDTVICGGVLPEIIKNRFVNSVDYNDDEFFQYQNAYLTAEGALMTAIEKTKFSLRGSNCVVLGSGRIAKALIPLLKGLNANITVVARKKTDRECLKIFGADAVDFSSLTGLMRKADLVFNTVPAPVIEKPQLNAAKKDCVIIDLASRPGGTDFEYAKSIGITAIHALAVPGKTSPYTAGRIIYDTVISLLKEKEVIF